VEAVLEELQRSSVHCDSTVALARRQFGNPEEGECPPLEASTRGVVMRQQTDSVYIVEQSG
jgi:hypothetical protein